MIRVLSCFALATILSLPAMAISRRDDKEDVKNAAKKLAGSANYSWISTPKSEGGGGGNRPQAGPSEGKTEKDGYTMISSKRGDVTSEGVIKGAKAAVKTADGWKSADDIQGGGGGRPDPASTFARGLKSFKSPAVTAEGLVDKVGELKKGEEGLYSGDLTEEGAKELLSAGGRQGGNPPTVAEPKGTVKFWVKDGVLVKYELNVQGKVTMGQRETAVNRTTTVEIKDVGATKFEVSDDAKKIVD